MKNTGILRIQTFAARQSAPVEGVTVAVQGDGFTLHCITDATGSAADIPVEAPACTLSLDEDNTTRPYAIVSLTAAKPVIEALKTPEIVIPQHTLDHSEIVKKLNIDAFVVGDDWYGKYDYLKDLGVQVFYFPYGTGVSSSNLKKTIHDSYEANLKSQRQSKPESVKGFGEKE